MGTRMIALTQVTPYEGDFQPGTRGYMSCTPPAAPGYKPGAVTLLFINPRTSNASILMYQQSRMQVSAAEESAVPRAAAAVLSDDPWGPIPPPPLPTCREPTS